MVFEDSSNSNSGCVSYVRIPGSGVSKPNEAIQLDLSKISNLAATVPINRNLPPALMRKRSNEEKEEESPKKKIKTTPLFIITWQQQEVQVEHELLQYMQYLRNENKELRDENKELRERLSLFQQLFKDKKRLTSVVQYVINKLP